MKTLTLQSNKLATTPQNLTHLLGRIPYQQAQFNQVLFRALAVKSVIWTVICLKMSYYMAIPIPLLMLGMVLFNPLELQKKLIVGTLCLPFVLQLLVGGFYAGGTVILWSVLPFLVLLFNYKEEKKRWIGLYAGLFAFVIASEFFVQPHSEVLVEASFFLFVINVSGVLLTLLMLLIIKQVSSVEYELLVNTVNQEFTGLRTGFEEENKGIRKKLNLLETQLKKTSHALVKNYDHLNQVSHELKITQHEKKAIVAKKNDVQNKEQDTYKMLGLLVHELRNPIHAVSNNATILTNNYRDLAALLEKYENLDTNGDLKAQLAEIEDFKKELIFQESQQDFEEALDDLSLSIKHSKAVTMSLRQLSHPQNFQKQTVDLEAQLHFCLKILKHKCKGGIKVEVFAAENLPQIEAYPIQINQLFINLISNAIQALEGKGSISIQLKRNKEGVAIVVTDTGKGMSSVVQKRIFEEYFTTKTEAEGTGLGLHLVKQIVETHQGSIYVESQEGKGSSFIVELS